MFQSNLLSFFYNMFNFIAAIFPEAELIFGDSYAYIQFNWNLELSEVLESVVFFFSLTSCISWNNFIVITGIWHIAEDSSWNTLNDNLRNEIWVRNHKNYY